MTRDTFSSNQKTCLSIFPIIYPSIVQRFHKGLKQNVTFNRIFNFTNIDECILRIGQMSYTFVRLVNVTRHTRKLQQTIALWKQNIRTGILLVYTRISLALCLYVLPCTRMYSYVTRGYLHVLVCTRMYSYVTRMLPVGTRMYSYDIQRR